MRLRPALALAAALLTGATTVTPLVLPSASAATRQQAAAAGDAVVIAVIDSGFSPYHQDFLASTMPQEARPALDKAPHTYLPGFPNPRAFASYAPLQLTLDGSDGTEMADLRSADEQQWASVRGSTGSAVQYRWVPGTKVIGALSFGEDGAGDVYGTGGGEHGMGSASVSTGNIYGTCPECLLVFIEYTTQESAEDALAWASRQPWIDAITNSYGFSLGVRDRYYNGTDLEAGESAALRGQTTFFSSGNGQENAFVVPNTTLLSSQEGPDWIVTVGATGTSDENLSGTGKPADVAGIGESYPSAYGADTVNGKGNFSGTSNATPQVAGIYGKALWEARRALAGASRVQRNGVIAAGGGVRCGAVRPGCELGDGSLTAVELRTRFFEGAKPTAGRLAVGGVLAGPGVGDSRFLSEGYGQYRGRLGGKYDEEFATRVRGPLFGTATPLTRPAGEVEWFRVDSWCRQLIWGAWTQGSYADDARTPLPDVDYAGWPSRSAIQEECPTLVDLKPAPQA